MGYVLLLLAIIVEVGATIALRLSDGLSRWEPAVGAVTGYLVSLGLLSLAMRSVPLGVSYSMWAGIGTAGALGAAWVVFGERMVPVQWAGVGLVLLGVVLLNAPRATGAAA